MKRGNTECEPLQSDPTPTARSPTRLDQSRSGREETGPVPHCQRGGRSRRGNESGRCSEDGTSSHHGTQQLFSQGCAPEKLKHASRENSCRRLQQHYPQRSKADATQMPLSRRMDKPWSARKRDALQAQPLGQARRHPASERCRPRSASG